MRCPTLTELPSPPPGKTGWPWTEETEPLPDTVSNGSPWPKVSIVTPSYNQGRFIEETIRSVLLQGYPNLEYIIMDGGSADESVEIIRKYEPWLAYWVSEPDRGQVHAINKGFQRGTGEILAWLNSDDVYCLDALGIITQDLIQHPEAYVLMGSCLLVNEQGHKFGMKKGHRAFTAEYFLKGGSVPGQPAVFFRREVINSVGNLNESLHYVLDWEFWLRISLHYPPEAIFQVDHVLAKALIWAQAKTSTGGEKRFQERRKILEQIFNDPDLPDHLSRLRAAAFSDLHWRRAFLCWQNAHYLLLFQHIVRAIWKHPRSIFQVRKIFSLIRAAFL